jgi:hypothetical protein
MQRAASYVVPFEDGGQHIEERSENTCFDFLFLSSNRGRKALREVK